jgi:hypothetical protein
VRHDTKTRQNAKNTKNLRGSRKYLPFSISSVYPAHYSGSRHRRSNRAKEAWLSPGPMSMGVGLAGAWLTS